jgi:MoxR-like ATPase
VTTNDANGDQFAWFAENFQTVQERIELAIKGKTEVVRLALVCLLAEGHLLVEDVPGTGKTSLARSLANTIGSEWQRIQFTPDLLPSDVTGVSIYNQGTGDFEFRPGPVFAGIVLADEINRASPKTQSALLEVMEEHTVTVDGASHPVPHPFMVVATQNPVDMDGTYALPEAQLDRFLMRISIGYPSRDAAIEILRGRGSLAAGPADEPVSVDEVRALVGMPAHVYVADSVYDYIVRVTEATRSDPDVRLGASPRGSLGLLRSAQVQAAVNGRGYVLPEDVESLAVPVLAHRLILSPDAELRGVSRRDVIRRVLEQEPAPQAASVG